MMDAYAGKTLPRPTPLTQAWWEACRNHELLIQRCSKCGHFQFYPRTFCTACNSPDVEWAPASGRGRVKTFTVIRQPVSKAYAPEVPYLIALIQLEEGPTMMSALVECEPESAAVGMPVEVVFEQWTEQITLPKFRPATAE